MKTKMTPSWDLVVPSTQLVRKHYLAVIYLMVLPGLVYLLGATLLGNPFPDGKIVALNDRQTQGVLIIFAGALWMLINLGPSTYFTLKGTTAEPAPVLDYYKHGLRFGPRLYVYYLVYGLLVFIGLLLLIIPGLIMLRRYFLGPYYLVDKKLSIRQALKLSAERSKPVSNAIWGIIGVEIAFVFAAAFMEAIPVIGIVLGQLISYVTVFLIALRYREVESK